MMATVPWPWHRRVVFFCAGAIAIVCGLLSGMVLHSYLYFRSASITMTMYQLSATDTSKGIFVDAVLGAFCISNCGGIVLSKMHIDLAYCQPGAQAAQAGCTLALSVPLEDVALPDQGSGQANISIHTEVIISAEAYARKLMAGLSSSTWRQTTSIVFHGCAGVLILGQPVCEAFDVSLDLSPAFDVSLNLSSYSASLSHSSAKREKQKPGITAALENITIVSMLEDSLAVDVFFGMVN